ncbi:unnamed protein product [Brassica rapa]|uniref:Uncharacterized protein n=2 Tax=Brassica TaxID=3705 RepID=A0A3P5Z9J8_BRACM|nr:unnamed protein product [Brassica rapa]VDC70763.1 unnamed protein product [Brassica rapa]
MVSHQNLLPHLRSHFSSGFSDRVRLQSPNPRRNNDSDSVTIPTSFMTGSIVGKRFYKKVMTREADDGSGWTVMLDYKTLKTPSKRPLKLPSLIGTRAWVWQSGFLRLFLHFTLMHLPVFTQSSAISSFRISDVSYEERDDPDGRLERRGLSGDS